LANLRKNIGYIIVITIKNTIWLLAVKEIRYRMLINAGCVVFKSINQINQIKSINNYSFIQFGKFT